jgi:hypothetical protein
VSEEHGPLGNGSRVLLWTPLICTAVHFYNCMAVQFDVPGFPSIREGPECPRCQPGLVFSLDGVAVGAPLRVAQPACTIAMTQDQSMLLNRRTLPWLIAALLMLGLAMALNRWLAPADRPSADGRSPVAATGMAGGGAAPAGGAASPGMKAPIDLMGLTVDAARLFEIGYAGGLTIDGRMRETLEILLSNLPEEPSADDIERLEWTLRDGLPAADAQKAIALFHGYRAYLKDMRGEYLRLGIPANREDAQAFFAQMEAVQRRHFGADTAEAVFGDELRHSRLVMEASFVAQDTSLSPEERQAQRRALRAQLPPELQDSIPDEAPAAASAP